MTTLFPRSSATPESRNEPPHGSVVDLNRGFALRSWRPTTTSVLVKVAGDLDSTTAPRLHELLASRPSSTIKTVILDLSELSFLSVVGLELLAHARMRATARGMAVCIVDGPVCVDRALHAAGWSETVPTYPTAAAVIAELDGRRRENAVHAVDRTQCLGCPT